MSQANASMLLVGVEPELEGKLLASVRGVEVARAALDRKAVSAAVAQARPAAAIVPVRGLKDAELPFRVVSELASGGTRVIVYGPNKDAELILRAMRAGAQEYVVAGEEKQLAEALRQSARAATESAPGSLVALFAPKGGMGSTAVAANLAATFARRGERVCLVDLDLQFGDALSLLDLPTSYALSDVVTNMHRLDRELLDTSVARHRDGMFVLGQGERIEEAEKLGPKELAAALAFLRQHYRYVVVDGLRDFSENALVALDAADRVLMLLTQEVPAVRNAQRAADLFRRLGYDNHKVRLVVNRFQPQAKVGTALLEEATGLEVAATLSNDFAALSDALSRGVLLAESAPRSPLTQDIERLAKLLQGGAEDSEAPKPFFARLFSRR